MDHSFLTIPSAWLGDDLAELLRGRRSHRDRPLHLSRETGGGKAIHGQALADSGTDPASGKNHPRLRILPLAPVAGVSSLPVGGLPEEVAAVLAVGLDAAVAGRAAGWIRRPDDGLFDPAVGLRFPGPGMAEIPPPGGSGPEPPVLSPDDFSKWSRTGAVLGRETLATMRRLSIGVTGLGRLGCAVVHYLVSLPVDRLVLIDPDTVEAHNLGEGGFFSETEIGLSKAAALEGRLALWHPEIAVATQVRSVTEAAALDALASCDAIFSCPDNPGARLAAAAVATAYHRPLIDLGTRISPASDEEDDEAMGADVRLVVPGDRCLLCFGGGETGRRILASPDFETAFAGMCQLWIPRGSF